MPLRRPQSARRSALSWVAAFAPAGLGRASVVDGPLTRLFGGRWAIDDDRLRRAGAAVL